MSGIYDEIESSHGDVCVGIVIKIDVYDDCVTNCNVSVCTFQNYHSEFKLDIDQNGLNEVTV